MVLNCDLAKTLESSLDSKKIKPVNPKENQSWIFIGRTGAEAETPILWLPDAEPTHWKRPWCWERLKVGEVGDREWDCWMASLTQWTWAWASVGRWWRTGNSGVLQSIGSQRVKHGWATKLNWTDFGESREDKGKACWWGGNSMLFTALGVNWLAHGY